MTSAPDLSAFLRETSYVGGAWIGADGGKTVDVTDPATGRTLGTVPDCGRSETRRAIEAAKAAFPAWRARTAKDRAGILHKLADLIEAEAGPLAALLTAEQGKSLAEATGEVKFSASYVRWFAEEAQRVYGDVIPSPWPGRKILVTHEPVGVVGAITPWNFPSSMIARKLAPALAAGCTIVVKPAMQTPYSGLAWGVLCERVGIPAGVVNILTGSASEIGAELTENRDVAKITFTGSTPVGKKLVAQCAPTLKRVSMELGGNAPFIVFDDADVERAVAGAMIAKFRNSGQTCVCTNRFLVQSGIHDRFVEALVKAVDALKVGNGMEPGTEQGPLIDDRAIAKVEAHIADALEKGAGIATGGHRHALGGTFFQPTVLTGVSVSAALAKEETFGPIAPVFKFETEAEAIALANDTEFGLASYFYTRDLGRAFRVAQALKSGMVGINEGLITTEVAPFGGVKESGMGREGSKYGIEDYLDMKYICVGGLDG
ncbi:MULTISPECIES: NAD-dependent succinate-semialdehyde dehydrogenase [unclassified Aureimonas]|uniref:NAD-dependent succinate-semialdehyde dehydrogenase n=1 Tax=unclassified Aureimonas TaxID=2615206 RepID=UPI0006FC5444|nr:MULTISPECIES: NAD-dependent succinate-semialdehyde dehydrogenase [unclassified Aureimonas]KQT64094.1 NAD-dependent succinate-semialdehyde dehydrogenase [Aureimonas sp. Leaf427]KQT81284.1 NAD-dependent succinate-semialdehyde dehydrogenase [Aureimonas sp. Leaf460]